MPCARLRFLQCGCGTRGEPGSSAEPPRSAQRPRAACGVHALTVTTEVKVNTSVLGDTRRAWRAPEPRDGRPRGAHLRPRSGSGWRGRSGAHHASLVPRTGDPSPKHTLETNGSFVHAPLVTRRGPQRPRLTWRSARERASPRPCQAEPCTGPGADVGGLTAGARPGSPGPGALLPSLPRAVAPHGSGPRESADASESGGAGWGGQGSGQTEARRDDGAGTMAAAAPSRPAGLRALGVAWRGPGRGGPACVPHAEAASDWGPDPGRVSCSGEASQVRILRPELQAAELPGGAQRALPQLPAEHGPPGHPVPR